MNKYVKWKNTSHQTSGGKWVPEAIADVIEGGKTQRQPIHLSDADHEKMKQGELTFFTADEAKAAAYEMVKRVAWDKWNIPEERIQEY